MLDQPGLHLLKVEPREGVTLDARQDGNVIHLTIGKITADGSLGMLTLRAQQGSKAPLNLSLQNTSVFLNQAPRPSLVALPKQLTVSD